MDSGVLRTCRRVPCRNSIPIALVGEQLCLDMFDRCREHRPLTSAELEWLLSDALLIVKNLEEGGGKPVPDQRERMLDLLLMLANLHEYVAHHSVHLDRPA